MVTKVAEIKDTMLSACIMQWKYGSFDNIHNWDYNWPFDTGVQVLTILCRRYGI